jgi:hypothetical protein
LIKKFRNNCEFDIPFTKANDFIRETEFSEDLNLNLFKNNKKDIEISVKNN